MELRKKTASQKELITGIYNTNYKVFTVIANTILAPTSYLHFALCIRLRAIKPENQDTVATSFTYIDKTRRLYPLTTVREHSKVKHECDMAFTSPISFAQ